MLKQKNWFCTIPNHHQEVFFTLLQKHKPRQANCVRWSDEAEHR